MGQGEDAMGFRYTRSSGLGNGVRLNMGKRGFSSVSVGRPGSTLNIGRRGLRCTVGLPGTGLSYSTGGGGGAGVTVAVLGLIGAAFGLLFWLLGAKARGSRLAQLALCTVAAFSLFAYLRAPDGGKVAPEPTLPPVTAPASVEASTPVTPTYTSSAALARLRLAATMKTTTGAKVRSGQSVQARVVGQLPAGALVEIIQGEGKWAKVRAEGSGAMDWVAWSLLTVP